MVRIDKDCNGTLITNNWIITARHCVSGQGLYKPETVAVTLGSQTRKGAEVIHHPSPYVEAALARVDSPMSVQNSYSGYSRSFRDTRIASANAGVSVTCLGYGKDRIGGKASE